MDSIGYLSPDPIGHRCFRQSNIDPISGSGMRKRKGSTAKMKTGRFFAVVEIIPDERASQGRGVDPDLVRAAGDGGCVYQSS
jgi:hypothetical protein